MIIRLREFRAGLIQSMARCACSLLPGRLLKLKTLHNLARQRSLRSPRRPRAGKCETDNLPENRKGFPPIGKPFHFGRDDWIRTSDLTHPKRARYQAAPRPVINVFSMNSNATLSKRSIIALSRVLASIRCRFHLINPKFLEALSQSHVTPFFPQSFFLLTRQPSENQMEIVRRVMAAGLSFGRGEARVPGRGFQGLDRRGIQLPS